MHDHHRFDRVVLVGGKARLDDGRVDAVAPVALDEFDLEPEVGRDAAPQRREVAGLEHQHPVARRQRVGERGFPRAGARRRVDHDVAVGLEDFFQAREHLEGQRGELGAAVVDGRHVHRPQHPVGHVGRAWNLQEVASRVVSHAASN